MNNIEKCFGKTHKCKKDCEFKEACASHAKDEIEDERRTSWGDIEYNDDIAPENENDEDPRSIIIGGSEVLPQFRAAFFDLVAKLCDMIDNYPTAFEFLRRKIYAAPGMSQADFARSKGRARQQINDLLNRELNVGQRRISQNKLLELTPKEFAVYKCLIVDGCTIREAAEKLKMPKSSIHRIGQNLRRKTNKTWTTKNNKT